MTKIPKNISGYLDHHEYPKIFYHYPILFRIIHKINFVLTLRNWYVLQALRQLEKKQEGHFTFLDAGFGMGEFSIGIAMRNKNVTVTAIDLIESNSTLANEVARLLNLKNVKFHQGDLSRFNSDIKFNLALCNSTMQFIKDDITTLKNICNVMEPKGTLLLYVPVTYKRYFPWSDYLEKKYLSDYFYKYHSDFLMHRYTEEEVIGKLRSNSFAIKKVTHAYGLFGAIAFEMYSSLLATLKILPLLVSIPVIICYVLIFLPLQIILMLIDFFQTNSNGNGLLIETEKE